MHNGFLGFAIQAVLSLLQSKAYKRAPKVNEQNKNKTRYKS